MSAVAEAQPAIRRRDLADTAQHLFESSGSTLEDRILGAWEDLAASGRAACPVCAGTLEPAGCAGCGSRLS